MKRNHANAVDENKINRNADVSEKTNAIRQLFTQNYYYIEQDNINHFLNSYSVKTSEIKNVLSKAEINELIKSELNNLAQSIENQNGTQTKTVSLYRKKPYSIWSGKGAKDGLFRFEHRLRTYYYKTFNMFHIILKVDHDSFTPFEAEDIVSKKWNRFTTNIRRIEKYFAVKKYQAVKEWDETSHPHLHLFIEMKYCKVDAKKLNEIISKYWKIGGVDIYRVKSEKHFDNCVTYCTRFSKKKNNKQMRLPDIFKDRPKISRFYYPQIKWGKERISIPAWRKAHKIYGKLHNEKFINMKFKKTGARNKNSKKGNYKKAKTYRQREGIDQTNLSIGPKGKFKPIFLTLETPMRQFHNLPLEYNRKTKASELKLSDENFRKLMAIEVLNRIMKVEN